MIITISVRYGEHDPEELAFRDGMFLHPYRHSSAKDGRLELRRDGGWPSSPTLIVREFKDGKISCYGAQPVICHQATFQLPVGN